MPDTNKGDGAPRAPRSPRSATARGAGGHGASVSGSGEATKRGAPWRPRVGRFPGPIRRCRRGRRTRLVRSWEPAHRQRRLQGRDRRRRRLGRPAAAGYGCDQVSGAPARRVAERRQPELPERGRRSLPAIGAGSPRIGEATDSAMRVGPARTARRDRTPASFRTGRRRRPDCTPRSRRHRQRRTGRPAHAATGRRLRRDGPRPAPRRAGRPTPRRPTGPRRDATACPPAGGRLRSRRLRAAPELGRAGRHNGTKPLAEQAPGAEVGLVRDCRPAAPATEKEPGRADEAICPWRPGSRAARPAWLGQGQAGAWR